MLRGGGWWGKQRVCHRLHIIVLRNDFQSIFFFVFLLAFQHTMLRGGGWWGKQSECQTLLLQFEKTFHRKIKHKIIS
jgi:hypothetical protein